MIRLLASIVIRLLANGVGLLVCAMILPNFSINGLAFIGSLLIFTIINVVIDPLISKLSASTLPALQGGVALISAFFSLILTGLLTEGLQIEGIQTWVLATLIVWLFSLIATLLLPLIIFKKTLAKHK